MHLDAKRLKIFFSSLLVQTRLRQIPCRPKSSEVLSCYLRQRQYPHWTAWYVPYCQVKNDLWGCSHFNHEVDGENYHILRTGAFPFVKFHCTRRPKEDLRFEDSFYRVLKVLNLGVPTLAYGLAGLIWASHTESVETEKGPITIFFWYRETPKSKY